MWKMDPEVIQGHCRVQRAVDMLVEEAFDFLQTSAGKEHKEQMNDDEWFMKQSRVVTIDTHRQAGLTTAGMMLLQKYGGVLLTADSRRAQQIKREYNVKDNIVLSVTEWGEPQYSRYTDERRVVVLDDAKSCMVKFNQQNTPYNFERTLITQWPNGLLVCL